MPEPDASEHLASLTAGSPGLLLTGATGFVGQHLQQHLLASVGQPSSITALVRAETPARRAELLNGVAQRALSLTSATAWQELIEEHPGSPIVFLAGSVRGRTYADFKPANVDIIGAAIAALGAVAAPPPILLVSSLAASQPDLSHYAASKFAGEQLVERTDLPWTILRPTAVYGRGDKELAGLFRAARSGVLPRLGPPDQRLSFIHVTDLCRAIAAWVEAMTSNAQAMQQQLYSIDDGTPDGYDWRELGQAIAPGKRQFEFGVPAPLLRTIAHLNLAGANLLGYQPMLSPGKVRELCYPRWLCDNVPFSQASGWQPTIDLSLGAMDYMS